jgi:hypothetical protein
MKPKWPEGFKRQPDTKLMKLSELRSSRTAHDEAFLQLYQRFLKSEILVGYTRLRVEHVEINDHPDHPTPDGHVNGFATMIREGGRPTVYVYRSPDNSKPSWICCDDVAAARAYLKLGLRWMPCAILDPSEEGYEHACMLFRSLGATRHVYERCTPSASRIHIRRAAGWKAEESHECIAELTEIVAKVLAQLRFFHRERKDQLHYHHTLASVLTRTARVLHGVEALLAAGMPDQAAPLVRSVYELCLSLYFDWLNPEMFGVHLLWNAALEPHELKEAWDDILKKTPSAERKQQDALRASFNKVQTIAAKVKLRAEMSPFAKLHKSSYRRFSSFAHQDFATTAMFSGALDEDVDPSEMRFDNERGLTRFLLYWLDMSVTSICAWIATDIGSV